MTRIHKWLLAAIVCVVLPLAQYASAEGFTVKPYLGYGFNMGRQTIGVDQAWNAVGTKTKDATLQYGAGSGIKLGVGLDYAFTENLSAEFGIGYSKGSEQDMGKMTDMQGGNINIPGGGVSNPGAAMTRTLSTRYIPITLTFKVRAKLDRLTPYAGFGPTLALSPKSSMNLSYTQPGMTYKQESDTTYGMGLGFHGVVGADYDLSDSMVLFFQAKTESLSFKTSDMKITKATLNGVDVLATKTKSEKETTYKDNIAGATGAANVPSESYATITPANSLSFTVGVGWKF